jgi:uncharacterized protein YeaO (DUF488 family)
LDCNREKDIPASAYIREFFETTRCDEQVNFKAFRTEYENSLNKGDSHRLQRVLDFKESENDEKVSAQARLHFSKWHNKQLVSALNWSNWFHYHTDLAERTLSLLGIAGVGYAGLKVVGASWR